MTDQQTARTQHSSATAKQCEYCGAGFDKMQYLATVTAPVMDVEIALHTSCFAEVEEKESVHLMDLIHGKQKEDEQ